MSSIRHSTDWFQAGYTWPDAIWEWPTERAESIAIIKTCVPYVDIGDWKPERDYEHRVMPMSGYPVTYDLLYASGHVDPNRREQKIGIRMTGQNLAAYRELGGTDGRLFDFCDRAGGKASRIDIAFDLFDFGIDPFKIYADWERDKVKTKARVASPFFKAQKSDKGKITKASTAYFGSRESEEYWRIYQKGMQMNTDLDWTRFEVELKGEKAAQAVSDIMVLGVEKFGKQMLREQFLKMPYKFWHELIEGESSELTPVGRKVTAHDAWMLNIILPMIQEDIRKEWEGAFDRRITSSVEGLIKENWTRRMMAIRQQYEYYDRGVSLVK